MKTRFAISLPLTVCLTGCLLLSAATDLAARTGRLPVEPYIWRNVEIVGGGFVSGIVFSPKQPDLIYARTDIGGAYRWNTTTKRWIPLNDANRRSDWNLYGIESIGVDPTDANRVYLAAGTYTNSWAGNGAILRSSDQGRTWQRTDLPYKLGGNEDGRSIGERLAVDPNRNSLLYFGSRHNGLWKSLDYGATWKQVTDFPVTDRTNGIGIGLVLFDKSSGASGRPTPTLYISVSAPGVNLYRSTDSGATWEAVPGQPEGLLPHHGVLDAQGTLYLTYGDGPGPNGMTDGAVWKFDTKTNAWTNITPVKPGSEGAGKFGYAGLALDAQHPGTVMVTTMDKWSTGDELYRSVDGGAHWKSLKPKAVRDSSASPFLNWGKASAEFGHWMGALASDPFHSGHVLYGTGATIWGSDDVTAADSDATTHWTVRAQGLEETAVQALISPPVGAHLLSALGDIGGFRHDDLTVSPRAGMRTNPTFNTTTGLDFAERRPDLIARVGYAGNGMRRGAYSTDGGTTWTPFGAEPEGSRGGGSIAVSANGGALIWTPNGGVPHVSHDLGAHWKPCAGLTGRPAIVADRGKPERFYACDGKAGKLALSEDGGITFAPRETNAPGGQAALYAVPGRAGDLWLPGGAGLFHSTDGGATFTRISSIASAEAIGFGKAAPGQTYPALYLTGKVGESQGVFRSDDGGANWAQINDEQHGYGTMNIIIGDPRLYGRVYLGTNGRGILYADPARTTGK